MPPPEPRRHAPRDPVGARKRTEDFLPPNFKPEEVAALEANFLAGDEHVAHLSTNSAHAIADHGHFIQVDAPRLVVASVKQVVERGANTWARRRQGARAFLARRPTTAERLVRTPMEAKILSIASRLRSPAVPLFRGHHAELVQKLAGIRVLPLFGDLAVLEMHHGDPVQRDALVRRP